MSEIYFTLAVEDRLSEAVARKILKQIDPSFHVKQCLCKGGQGYLKTNINAFNKAANSIPFFVLTDQDRGCPPMILSKWLKHEANKYLIFRIAVMEIESWILAHRGAFAEFLSISPALIPNNTDSIEDPKQLLLTITARSRSTRLKSDIIPKSGSTATVGPDYNNRLSLFVKDYWNPFEASENSESLARALNRIKQFKDRYEQIKETSFS
ncbi:MAG: hypothetical protein MJE63_32715 [Proteobacteria bacterium]|nr:hypothetical protein [Pseudomonadota bacterium]